MLRQIQTWGLLALGLLLPPAPVQGKQGLISNLEKESGKQKESFLRLPPAFPVEFAFTRCPWDLARLFLYGDLGKRGDDSLAPEIYYSSPRAIPSACRLTPTIPPTVKVLEQGQISRVSPSVSRKVLAIRRTFTLRGGRARLLCTPNTEGLWCGQDFQ